MHALKLVEPHASSDMAWWTMAKEQAQMLIKTGFLPESIKTAEQAVMVMMKGRELGIPSLYALSNIVIIKGKPTCSAELMLALIYRDHGDAAMQFVSASNEECTIAYRRRGWEAAQRYSFTVADATRANLMGSMTWKQYTGAMLRARCISAVARMAFPDSIGGLYTSEELGGPPQLEDEDRLPVEIVDTNTGEIFDTGDLPPERPETNVPAVERFEGGCTRNQLARVHILATRKGLTNDGIRAMHGKASGKLLSEEEAAALIAEIETFPDLQEELM